MDLTEDLIPRAHLQQFLNTVLENLPDMNSDYRTKEGVRVCLKALAARFNLVWREIN